MVRQRVPWSARRSKEAQRRALKEAVRRGTSVAELTRPAMDRWLETSGVVPTEERRSHMLDMVGRLHSSRSDISERHDDHLDAKP